MHQRLTIIYTTIKSDQCNNQDGRSNAKKHHSSRLRAAMKDSRIFHFLLLLDFSPFYFNITVRYQMLAIYVKDLKFESVQSRKSRLKRRVECAEKALIEKNVQCLLAQREQEERNVNTK
ncbi:hypothetical protein C5167_020115 [Papaver somniferum]|uniref:Uncharacterized protein n=1 Tax=Papaver somniferum TaxID=3469 RepID=A0A4Y7IV83_PAPSO|nr:hypothetical protein C5167_020115 [Papaver somniferum]